MSFFPKHGRFSSINVGTIQTKFINSDAITNSITIDDISPTTTKGDILVDDGTNVIRFPIGTASQILSTDLTETSGLKWIAAPSGGGSFTASSTDTLTNKTFDIDGTGNVFRNRIDY
jgi:hypothetical protein